MRVMRKLRSRSGFTLAETLVAVMILVLVAGIVAEGVPVAKNAYEKVVVAANARVALSTMVTALRNELTTATDVKVDSDNKTITYYSPERGARSKISLSSGTKEDGTTPSDDPEGTIMIQEYLDYVKNNSGEYVDSDSLFALLGTSVPSGGSTASASARRLVSRAASNGDLFITIKDDATGGIEGPTQTGMITIKGLAVYRKVGDAVSGPLAELDELKIRNITGKTVQTGGE